MADEIYAVLIADVIASSARKNMRAQLGNKLAAASEKHLNQKLIRFPYTVTAGDEFQTISTELAPVPALLLDLRAMLQPLPLRIGVGIGEVAGRLQPPVNRLSGPAFQFARRGIDNVKAGSLFKFETLTAFASGNEHFDQTINLLYGLHDTLVSQITSKQWETIRQFLAQPALEQTAKRLKLDISTVSRNLKRGYYWQLSETAKATGAFIERTLS
ncbi:MAG TPA: SatD family protein [Candidatus Acidoferrum sp.]|nr:SatD family protein [Candidatus Acidoferrum sp.]